MTDWPPTLPPGTLVFCPACDRTRVAMLAPSGGETLDLLCSDCRYVVATLSKGEVH